MEFSEGRQASPHAFQGLNPGGCGAWAPRAVLLRAAVLPWAPSSCCCSPAAALQPVLAFPPHMRQPPDEGAEGNSEKQRHAAKHGHPITGESWDVWNMRGGPEAACPCSRRQQLQGTHARRAARKDHLQGQTTHPPPPAPLPAGGFRRDGNPDVLKE